jgi:penicillin-insensitive murein endopeptidase
VPRVRYARLGLAPAALPALLTLGSLTLALAACAGTGARAERMALSLPIAGRPWAPAPGEARPDTSASLGRPNGGALLDALQMPVGDAWQVMAAAHAWATRETIDALIAAIVAVDERFAPSHRLAIGDMSREFGGPFYPHRSHQSGRDVDLGYYYLPAARGTWYVTASAATLDVARSWALVAALIDSGMVEYIFIDRQVQQLLREHARARGVEREQLELVFQPSPRRDTLIRHARGHATHMHVRFHNPVAEERGRAIYRRLAARALIGAHGYMTEHRASAGDDLASLASRYRVPVRSIALANRLREPELLPGHVYRIPRRGRLLAPN